MSKIEKTNKQWEEIDGDEKIKKLVNNHTVYLGHSTSNIDWLLNKKSLKFKSAGLGSILITSIPIENEPDQFLKHLKKRVNPQKEYYNRGKYC